LVVEDDPVLRALECMVLADAGYPVLQVPNGQAALAAVRLVHPLAVITDVRMPEMDGPTFVRRYRAWCATPPPVIALSGSPGGLAEAAAAGVEVTLAKPFEVAHLVQAVRQVVPHDWAGGASPGQKDAAGRRGVTSQTEAAAVREYARAVIAKCQAHHHQASRLYARITDARLALDATMAARRQSLAAGRRAVASDGECRALTAEHARLRAEVVRLKGQHPLDPLDAAAHTALLARLAQHRRHLLSWSVRYGRPPPGAGEQHDAPVVASTAAWTVRTRVAPEG